MPQALSRVVVATAVTLTFGSGTLALRAGAATGTSVSVTASDKALSGVGSSLKGGITTFTFKNVGKDRHGLQLAWIVGRHTDAELLAALGDDSGKIPTWLHAAGGVGPVQPGGTGSVTVNLRRGTYAYWSDEGDDHADFKAGLKGRFTVTSERSSAEPTAAATVVAKEYGFDVNGLKPGLNTFAFSDAGKQLHHLVAVPLNPGKTAADVARALETDPNDKNAPPPPIDFEKAQNTAVVDPGVTQVVQMNLPAGRYVFMCFLTDRAGGQPHAMKGMIKEVTIR